jgi:hypothetical protein
MADQEFPRGQFHLWNKPGGPVRVRAGHDRRVDFAVRRIRRPTRRLGACHSGYGVTHEHYEATGPVLLDALDDTLGSAYTDEVRDAWRLPLDLVAETMI